MKKEKEMKQEILRNSIDQKVNELAKQVMPENMYEIFLAGKLEYRVALIGGLAAMANDKAVMDMCEDFLGMLK